MWSWALDARRKAYTRRGETLTSVGQSRILTRIKRSSTRRRLVDASTSIGSVIDW